MAGFTQHELMREKLLGNMHNYLSIALIITNVFVNVKLSFVKTARIIHFCQTKWFDSIKVKRKCTFVVLNLPKLKLCLK